MKYRMHIFVSPSSNAHKGHYDSIHYHWHESHEHAILDQRTYLLSCWFHSQVLSLVAD